MHTRVMSSMDWRVGWIEGVLSCSCQNGLVSNY